MHISLKAATIALLAGTTTTQALPAIGKTPRDASIWLNTLLNDPKRRSDVTILLLDPTKHDPVQGRRYGKLAEKFVEMGASPKDDLHVKAHALLYGFGTDSELGSNAHSLKLLEF